MCRGADCSVIPRRRVAMRRTKGWGPILQDGRSKVQSQGVGTGRPTPWSEGQTSLEFSILPAVTDGGRDGRPICGM